MDLLSFILLISAALISLIFSFDVAIALPQQTITLTEFTKLYFPPNVSGSGSLTFDAGGDLYAGTTDGRVLRFSSSSNSWVNFSYTSPKRNYTFCDGTNPAIEGSICGFPTALSFSPSILDILGLNLIYATDAYYGLESISDILGVGGAPRVLVSDTAVEPPMKFPTSVDAANNGMVYFTDASTKYGPLQANISIASGDTTGRLVEYNPITGQVTTLLTTLGWPSGVATSSDASFVLVTDEVAKNILRYELTGAERGTNSTFQTFEERPAKIKRTRDGNFWTVTSFRTNGVFSAPTGVKLSPSGDILATVDLSANYINEFVTLAAEQDGELFVGGVNINFVGKYKIVYS